MAENAGAEPISARECCRCRRAYTDALSSSANADLMLDTTFTDAAALKGYSTHPAHVAVADGKVRPYTAVRTCLDFNV